MDRVSPTTTNDGRATITGTIAGAAIRSVGVTALVGPITNSAGNFHEVLVAITNFPDACAVIGNLHNPSNGQVLMVSVAGTSDVVPGTYSFLSSLSVGLINVTYTARDSMCVRASGADTSAGTVTLTAAGPSTVEGSFDVTLDQGDHLTGTFNTPVCNVILNDWNNSPLLPCGQ